MLWLLERGMELSQSKSRIVRWIGKILMFLPIQKAKRIERRLKNDE